MKKDPYQELENKFNRIYQLQHLAAIAHWDMATMMPTGGSQARGKALAEMSELINDLVSESEIGDLLKACDEKLISLTPWQQANIREIERKWLNATSISSDLVKAKSLAGSKCEHAWRSLRKENNWKDFYPLLKNVIDLTIEESQQRAQAMELSPYDALLNLYEPGQKSSVIDNIFLQLIDFIPGFIQEVLEKQKSQTIFQPPAPFAVEQQRQLGLALMQQVGFDFQHGRLDVSAHPFCGGVAEDVRITTRYSEHDFGESLMGVLHETGHAKYEQGLPQQWRGQPVGEARGMGIHESQSLFQEMQVSRSQAFIRFAAPLIRQYLAADVTSEAWSTENLYRLNNQVKAGYIRVNADEVTYPMHVILRYQIEKALIDQQLQVADLPEVWDQKMQEYLGLSTQGNYKDGCMQDIHWTDGSLGYFPTYTLGAMNAAQFYVAASKAIPNLEAQIEEGDFAVLNQWQSEKIWSQASFHSIDDLMIYASGESLNPKFFIRHLKSRYLE